MITYCINILSLFLIPFVDYFFESVFCVPFYVLIICFPFVFLSRMLRSF